MRKSNRKIVVMFLFIAAVVSFGAYAANGGEDNIDKRVRQAAQDASCCASGFNLLAMGSNPGDKDAKKLDEERSLFLKTIEPLRQGIQEKSATLRDELNKKNPDVKTAESLQGDISNLQAQLAKERIKFLIKTKALKPNLRKGYGCPATSNISTVEGSCCGK